ncbi:class A beta-lactamase-related serine hydrolase [Synechocystis sp. PCC 7339]|uniref:serine hydrolase n=1 Tax=unclassified Synechocystis TaxID=2640012 RepID=UPI001BAF21FE|nr:MULTISPECIES: serine hydrolase [unclassified Synechocystis]QUS60197.1 class A beta-lactamase-related serine hydrolase [Synechocystis sp. PCC 7338]UAJ72358.1 class A beta-lactamase-related serine hydrolase [Synechocystis sp. PCC 7339]
MITSMPRRPKSRRAQRRNLRVISGTSTPSIAEVGGQAGASIEMDQEQSSPKPGETKANPFKVVSAAEVKSVGKGKNVSLRPRKPSKPLSWWQKSLLTSVRLGIVGLGIGAIAGTAITTFSPTKFIRGDQDSAPLATGKEPDRAQPVIYPQKVLASIAGWVTTETDKLRGMPATATPETAENHETTVATAPSVAPNQVKPIQQDQALTQKLTVLGSSKAPAINSYSYFIDVDNGQFANAKGETKLPAASTIKIPVAIAFFEAVDQGKIQLHEELPLTQDVIVGEAGTMQYDVGKRSSYPALEVVTKMIVISDNTATNMLIKRLGGKEFLNQRLQTWQMPQTKINNYLPDLEGTNTTSPQDLALLLVKLQGGEFLSLKSRDRLLNIMQQTKTRTLLPQGLEPEAQIAHKTGDIGTVLGDAGIVDMPNGKRYVGAVLATRPHNDVAGRSLIQDISRTAYQHYKGITPPATPSQPPAKKETPSGIPAAQSN